MMNFVYTLCSSTPGQIQYGGFKRALAKKSGDMIRHRVRILYLLFLWFTSPPPNHHQRLGRSYASDHNTSDKADITSLLIYNKLLSMLFLL